MSKKINFNTSATYYKRFCWFARDFCLTRNLFKKGKMHIVYINLYAKFDVSSFYNSRDLGVQTNRIYRNTTVMQPFLYYFEYSNHIIKYLLFSYTLLLHTLRYSLWLTWAKPIYSLPIWHFSFFIFAYNKCYKWYYTSRLWRHLACSERNYKIVKP